MNAARNTEVRTEFDHRSGRTWTVDGATLYFEEIGRLSGPPLVLLHGGIGTIEDFRSVVAPLARDYRVIGIDSRGHGRSTLGPEPLTYARLVRDVDAILDQLGIQTCSLIGFSDGGIVGYRLAAAAKPRVTKLITIGSPAEIPQEARIRELYARITGESWRAKFPEMFTRYQALNPEPDFDRLVAAAKAMWTDPSESGHPGELVSKISCPVLLVRGDEDHLAPRASLSRLADRLKSAFSNIAFAGHVAFDDQPEVFLAAATRFLKNDSSAP